MFIESHQSAVKWRRIQRDKLGLGNKRQRRVARKLGKCCRHQRCGTEACRVCLREFRIAWAGEAIKIMARRRHWTRCCIIPKGLLMPYAGLANFDLNAAVKRIRKRLERSAIRDRIVLGALDVSLNVDSNVIQGWQFPRLFRCRRTEQVGAPTGGQGRVPGGANCACAVRLCGGQ